ncbi:MAG: bactofilin family protein [Kiritimatiellia bacterium]|jgi:cytoskeletal protein CcmA (bactofilin family)
METDKTPKTLIAEDIEITGSIKCASSVQFDGKLNGDLVCTAAALFGKSAVVKGNVSAESVSVSGAIAGNITAKDRIEMKSTAKVEGDIRAKRLTVEDGVTFIGKSEVNPGGFGDSPAPRASSAPTPPPTSTPASSATSGTGDSKRG